LSGRTRLLFACESPKSTLWDVEFVVEDILAKGFPALNVVAELYRYPLGPYAPEQFTLEEEGSRSRRRRSASRAPAAPST
jgi:hypothetical protein